MQSRLTTSCTTNQLHNAGPLPNSLHYPITSFYLFPNFVKKTEWWGAGVVICLERGADLHMVQRMPLPLTVSCFSKIQIGFTFLVPAHQL